ncbi:holin [Cutibacterium avidum]|uniref:holin n=1 Tax=Cutibacterium avidum TaxID=33010 RepID=UPI002FF38BCE
MSAAFWKGACERAIKTFIQTFIAVLGVTAGAVYTADTFIGLPWSSALITALVATILSVATSLGAVEFVTGNPSAAPVEAGLVQPPTTDTLDVPDDDPGMIEPINDDAPPADGEPDSAPALRHAQE